MIKGGTFSRAFVMNSNTSEFETAVEIYNLNFIADSRRLIRYLFSQKDAESYVLNVSRSSCLEIPWNVSKYLIRYTRKQTKK